VAELIWIVTPGWHTRCGLDTK